MQFHIPDSKVRVLRIIARLNIGGPAIHVVNLNAGLDPSRYEQVLVSGPENPGEGSMLDYAISRGVKPVIMPEIVGQLRFGVADVKALAKLYRLMCRERPHIVHTHTAKAGFLGRLSARLAGVPIIIHTYHGHILRGYYGPLTSWFLRCMERALAFFTDGIIAVSEEVKRDLLLHGITSPDKITVIPLGFQLEPFLNSEAHRDEFRHELGLNNTHRLVGIVGRIVPIKNHRLFLEAAATVAVEEPAARFIVVGDGELRPEMEEYARKLGIGERVIFTSWRRDLPRIYADLDVLAITSNNEGTPVSAIEAMAAGCPVVATRVGGVPDLIKEGETGYLAPPGDGQSLAAALLRLLRDPEAALRVGQAAQAVARDRFHAKRLTADMEGLYSHLLSEEGVSSLRSVGSSNR